MSKRYIMTPFPLGKKWRGRGGFFFFFFFFFFGGEKKDREEKRDAWSQVNTNLVSTVLY